MSATSTDPTLTVALRKVAEAERAVAQVEHEIDVARAELAQRVERARSLRGSVTAMAQSIERLRAD